MPVSLALSGYEVRGRISVELRQKKVGPCLLETVLAVHAGALVHVGFGDVGTAAAGDALLDTLADKSAHQKWAALYAPVCLRVPGDPRLSQGSPLSLICARILP